MKTNIGIVLTDEERDRLANILDGKTSKRLATRKDVTAMVEDFVRGMVECPEVVQAENRTPANPGRKPIHELHIPDPEDAQRLAGKSPSYIRGVNKVKHGYCAKR